MTIENKALYNLFKSVKIPYNNGIYGLYLEGFNGGINAYVTDGIAVSRKTFYGDNKKEFVSYFHSWQKKDGYSSDIETLGEKDSRNFLPKLKAYLELEKYNKFTVNAKEFKQAIRAVSAVHKGERGDRHITLSIHNGKFDIASWINGESAVWQLDGEYQASGAVCISKFYMDCIKADKMIEFSYSKMDNRIALNVKSDIESVIMPRVVDPAEFKEVLQYEYTMPEKPVEVEIIPTEQVKKPARRRMPKPVDTRWKSNRLGTKQTMVCKW